MAMTDANATSQTHLLRTRDQRRALDAYQCVQTVLEHRDDYKIAVNDLGATILRSGLAAAMATLERRGERGKLLLSHLALAKISGLEAATEDTLPELIRGLSLDGYMIATREMLEVAKWIKRAVQATFEER